MSCDCTTEIDPSWEPESVELFESMVLGRFPLNKRIKIALDKFMKAAKGYNRPCSIIVEGNGTDTIADDRLANRGVSAVAVDEILKTSGFEKTGATDADKLASSSIQFTDGTPVAGSKILIVFN